jgi:hypothetical protein
MAPVDDSNRRECTTMDKKRTRGKKMNSFFYHSDMNDNVIKSRINDPFFFFTKVVWKKKLVLLT